MTAWQISFLEFIRHWQELYGDVFWDKAFVFITSLGNGGFIWLLIIVFLLYNKKTRTLGWSCLWAFLIALILVTFIKEIVDKPRPYQLLAWQIIIPPPHGSSFPSGHTATAFAMAFAVFFQQKKLSIPFFFLAFLMGFSRIYLLVHYPLDVLAGLGLGFLAALFSCQLIVPLLRKKLPQKT
ncbi:MAG: phosphatase PAP2 family protein [Clostridiales bacterium]